MATWTCTAPSHHSVHVVRPFRSRVRPARRRIRPVWLPSTGASSVRSVERARWGLRNLCFARQADTERRRARRHASAQVHVWRGISVSQEVQAILPASAVRTHRPDLSSHPLQARPKRPAVSGVCCLPLCPLAPPICDTVRRALNPRLLRSFRDLQSSARRRESSSLPAVRSRPGLSERLGVLYYLCSALLPRACQVTSNRVYVVS